MQPAVQACCELPTSPALATTPRFLLHQFLLGAAPSACFGGCHVTTPCIDSSHSSVFGPFSRQTAAAISAFPVKSSRGSAVPGGGDDSRAGTETHEFAVNFAEAVAVLSQDLPCTFRRDPRFHIFSDDITLRTPGLCYSRGLWQYGCMHRAARWLGNLLYADLQLTPSRMWQPAGNRRQLRVCCCLSGRARLSLSSVCESTEVISTYTLDSRGKICEHQLDQIIPPEAMLVRFLEWMVARLQPGLVAQCHN